MESFALQRRHSVLFLQESILLLHSFEGQQKDDFMRIFQVPRKLRLCSTCFAGIACTMANGLLGSNVLCGQKSKNRVKSPESYLQGTSLLPPFAAGGGSHLSSPTAGTFPTAC